MTTMLQPEPDPRLVEWMIPTTAERACAFAPDDPAGLSVCGRHELAGSTPVSIVGVFCQPCLDAVTLAAVHGTELRRKLAALPDWDAD